MRTSRINTPLKVKIDEWLFHFNGKSVKVTIHLQRPRDPEGDRVVEASHLATFHAYFDRKHLETAGITDAGFPLTPISDKDYNALYVKVKDTIESSKNLVWQKVIVIATKGVGDDHRDDERIKFSWGVGYQSNDGKLFKRDLSTNYVTKRVTELLPRSFSFDDLDTVIYPYDGAMEAALTELDGMFERFTGALRIVIRRPDVLLNIKNRLLPFTTEEIPPNEPS